MQYRHIQHWYMHVRMYGVLFFKLVVLFMCLLHCYGDMTTNTLCLILIVLINDDEEKKVVCLPEVSQQPPNWAPCREHKKQLVTVFS